MTIMKHQVIIIAAVLSGFFYSGADSFAQYYRYIDMEGVVHLTNDYNSKSCKTYGCSLVLLPPENTTEIADKGKVDLSRNEEPDIAKQVLPVPKELTDQTAVANPDDPAAALAGKKTAVDIPKPAEKKSVSDEAIQNLLTQWLNSWKSGDMKTYRNCYADNFQSRGMNLDGWITYKGNIYRKSKNISIRIDHLLVKTGPGGATATFTQHYSSSRLKESGKKKLELKNINNEWKIYREIM